MTLQCTQSNRIAYEKQLFIHYFFEFKCDDMHSLNQIL